ncbi:ABC transporter ATP-binding protein [Falsarthrobacter nasiphocae]|uniref:ABC-2 type transport system ATP-binding protein n=1 Tax=Falsarthrobacter nasiphocae TaxID=189863 RepID=A0AAE3YGZ7_9MICC|nr:ABC transporter ATP-binding protein [Falsarthrobacter nasiphocae]MDR6892107.1 ABC-2 type transport system ATP-binding protein [Falsarthrobacter nasiphocae]
MIQVENLTKRYGNKVAVNNVSFEARPGRVTGFLGPNGAGKSTTMRMILGLDTPTAGRALVDGKPYREATSPLSSVGALLDAKAVHTGRSARSHLRAMAATHGLPNARVDEVISMTGLDQVAKRKVGGFSLGMGQRLGIASALLGDPKTVIFDEPVNGLDPEGVTWVRNLCRYLASEGRTVFLSSHLMSEMAQTADDLVIIGKGQIIAQGPITDIIAGQGEVRTLVRTDNVEALTSALAGHNVRISTLDANSVEISGVSPRQIAETAFQERIFFYELTPRELSLEEAYMRLTQGAVEYHSAELNGAQEVK